MEIIKRKSGSFLFRALKPFRWAGYTTEVGQEIQMAPAEGLWAIQKKLASPVDVPEIAEYIALVDFVLGGEVEGFRAKRGEKVLLKRDQAISLMLERKVIPVDEFRWRPFGLRLLKPGEADSERRRIEALDKSRKESDWKSIGILQNPKGGK